MNRLRPHFAKHSAQKPKVRLQSAIVADYRDDIVSLIADDGATLPEVAAAVRAEGEPVLEPGFKAAILNQIGKVKDIRAGKVKAAWAKNANAASAATPMVMTSALTPASRTVAGGAAVFLDEDDADFGARRPRG